MPRSVLRSWIRALACRRGAAMGYSSLALLVAIAAITLLKHAGSETGARHQRPVSAAPSN